jgi:hypothetical protein
LASLQQCYDLFLKSGGPSKAGGVNWPAALPEVYLKREKEREQASSPLSLRFYRILIIIIDQ